MRHRPDRRRCASAFAQVVQHRLRRTRHQHRRRRAAPHRAGVRSGHRSRADPAAGGRVDRRPHRRRRRPRHVEHRAEGRRADPAAERDGRRDRRQRRRDDAAVPGRQTSRDPTWPTSARPPRSKLRRAVSPQVASYTYGSDDRRRAGDPAEGSHRRRADRIQDRHGRARHRSAEHPAARLVHRVRPGQGTRRSPSPSSWRMAATDCPRPVARWPRRSAGPPSPLPAGGHHEPRASE